jgi:hypothetical protein
MRIILTLFAIHVLLNAFAQNYPRQEIDLSSISEELIPYQDEDMPYEDLLENYIHLFDHPINLNKASTELLQATNLFTSTQLENLTDHIMGI